MKNTTSIIRLSVLFFLLLAAGVSCTKEATEPTYDYFVSKTSVETYDTQYLKDVLAAMAGTMPELNAYASLLTSDVRIYKVIYRTTVKGEETDVSGLVCVPVAPGNYPVISFQNGTNTLNANAPSESPAAFQLIGMVASMGFIVTVADYPGFGESSGIPHPYLVKEPIVNSLVDLLHTVKEMSANDQLEDAGAENEYYLLGYSLGGWATLALHKELELNRSSEFNLKGSMCGAGPYDINVLLNDMIDLESYNMPVYMGYILYAYTEYEQFSNPRSDIFNEPYASRLDDLFKGNLGMSQINEQLTTNISDLLTPEFVSGFAASPRFAPVRNAFTSNSIQAWDTHVPLLLVHGSGDTQVDPVTTENLYGEMIAAGTSTDVIHKLIFPGDHGDAAVPAIAEGIAFILELRSQN